MYIGITLQTKSTDILHWHALLVILTPFCSTLWSILCVLYMLSSPSSPLSLSLTLFLLRIPPPPKLSISPSSSPTLAPHSALLHSHPLSPNPLNLPQPSTPLTLSHTHTLTQPLTHSITYSLTHCPPTASPFKPSTTTTATTATTAPSSSSKQGMSHPTGWPGLDNMMDGQGLPSYAVVEITGAYTQSTYTHSTYDHSTYHYH